jgi:hypothetical protein
MNFRRKRLRFDPVLDSKLDERLSSTKSVAETLKALPEDSVSLAWRSQLNEKIAMEAQRSARRNRQRWFLMPATGVALAGALSAIMLFHSDGTQSAPASAGFASELVEIHQREEFTSAFGGPSAADPVSPGTTPNDLWNEAESLGL